MKIQILICQVLLVITSTSMAQKKDNLRIRMTTDRVEYAKNRTVHLEITNNSKDTLYLYQHFITYESLEMEYQVANEWVNADIKSAIDGIMVTKPFAPGQTIKFNWEQYLNKKGHWGEVVPANKGTYRFKLNYWEKTDICWPIKSTKRIEGCSYTYRGYFITYSNQFKIK